jgi:hypothetical protein
MALLSNRPWLERQPLTAAAVTALADNRSTLEPVWSKNSILLKTRAIGRPT